MEKFVKVAQDLLQLDATEAKCYEILLLKGHVTIGELCGYLDLPDLTEYDKVSEICEKFEKLGLAKKIKKVEEKVAVYLPLNPFDALAKYLKEFCTNLDKDLDKMQTDLKDLRNSTENEIKQNNEHLQKSLETTITAVHTVAESIQTQLKTDVDTANAKNQADADAATTQVTGSMTKFKTAWLSKADELKSGHSKIIDQRTEAVTETTSKKKEEIGARLQGFTMEVSESLDGVETTLKAQVESFGKQTSDQITAFIGTTHTTVTEYTKTDGEALDSTEKKITTDLIDLKTKLDNEGTQFSQNANAAIENLEKTSKDAVEKIPAGLKPKIADLTAKSKDQLHTLTSTAEATLSESNRNHTDALTKLVQNNRESLTTQVDAGIKTLEQRKTTHLAKVGEECLAFTTNIGKSLEDGFNTGIKSLDDALKAQAGEISVKLAEQKTVLTQSLDTKETEFKSSMKKQVHELGQTTTDQQKTLADAIKTQQTALGTTLSVFKDGITQRFEAVKQEMQKAIESVLSQEQTALFTKIDGLQTQMAADLDLFKANIEGKLSEFNSQVGTQTQIIQQEIDIVLAGSKQTFTETTGAAGNLITTETGNMVSKTTEILKSVRDSSNTQAAEITSSLKATVESNTTEFVSQTTSGLNSVKDNMVKETESFQNAVTATLTQILADWKTATGTHVSGWTGAVDQTAADISTQLDDLSAKLRESADKTAAECRVTLENMDKQIKESVAMTIQSTSANIGETIKVGKEQLGVLAEKTQKSVQTTATGLMDAEAAAQTAMVNAITQNITAEKQKATELATSTQTDLNSHLDATKESVLQDLSRVKTESEQLYDQGKTEFGASADGLLKTSTETITGAKERFTGFAGDTHSKASGAVNKIDTTVKTEIDTASIATTTQLTEIGKAMLAKIEATSGIVVDPVKRIREQAATRQEFLETVYEDVFKWETLGSEGTWLLCTESAIHNFLKSMILRTKTVCFIVVPDLKLVPIDVLKKTKKTQKITIAVGPNPDPKLAAEILGLGDNIKIKVITVLEHKIYGAERDSEEAFYGPFVEKGDEMVVTVTTQTEMISVIGEALSPYWLGRSQAYKSPDANK
jgi:hypothetical protein